MGPGSLALTWALCTVAAAPSGTWHINQHKFQIPVRIKEEKRASIKEVQLYFSADRGATWSQAGVAPPGGEGFTFFAPRDGLYWFNVTSVDLGDRRDPPDPKSVEPSLKVQVDTVQPALRWTALERQGDEVALGWEIQEENADLATLKVEYRTSDSPSDTWYPVNVTPNLQGTTRIRVNHPGTVTVRMFVADLAGNQASATRDLAPGTTSGPSPRVAAAPSPTLPGVAGFGPGVGVAGLPPLPESRTPEARKDVPALPETAPSPRLPGGAAPAVPSLNAQTQPAAERSWPTMPTPGAGLANTGFPSTGMRQVSATAQEANQVVVNAGAPPLPARGFTGGMPIQLTNSNQVSLDYEVKAGPSGVGSVELYLTTDEGRTWRKFSEDNDLRPPFVVDLPGEGLFGLYLVVRGKSGLGRRPPVPNDPPQMRVEVDLTPPTAQLAPPEVDTRQRDALVLSWNVNDRNLGPGPATLEWADHPNGRWTMIAADQPPTGRFTWQLPPNVPGRVYFRLVARDSAGNSTTAAAPQPVVIDLPEAQLIGIRK